MSSDKSQAAQRQLCPAGREQRVLSITINEVRLTKLYGRADPAPTKTTIAYKGNS